MGFFQEFSGLPQEFEGIFEDFLRFFRILPGTSQKSRNLSTRRFKKPSATCDLRVGFDVQMLLINIYVMTLYYEGCRVMEEKL